MLHNHHCEGHCQQVGSTTKVTLVLLVDGTIQGDSYITPIVIVSKIMQMVHLVIVELTNHSLQNHVTWFLQGMIGQLTIHKVTYLHNLETMVLLVEHGFTIKIM